MSATVLGMGVVAPGVVGVAALERALAAEPGREFRVSTIGDEANPKAKRLPRIDRMALAAAREALGAGDVADTALVYGTGYGGLAATADFLDGMASRGPAFASPTAFHQSVHHGTAGQLSISLAIRGACLTESARELSGEAALRVGLDLLSSGRAEKVLVVAADEVVPALFSAFRAFGALADEGRPLRVGHPGVRPGEGAAAVLLGRNGEGPQIVGVRLLGHPARGLGFAADAKTLAPLLSDAAKEAGPTPIVSAAACGATSDTSEAEAIRLAFAEATVVYDALHFGLNPAGGLLRVVAAIARLRSEETRRGAVVHGLALGGGQAAVVVRRDV